MQNDRDTPLVRQQDGNDTADDAAWQAAPKLSVFGRQVPLPRSRWLRITIGVALMVFGVFGFLPILGFWMLPLGLLVLSYEFATVRRWRRRFAVWWERRKASRRASPRTRPR